MEQSSIGHTLRKTTVSFSQKKKLRPFLLEDQLRL